MKFLDIPNGTKIGQITINGISHKSGNHVMYSYDCSCGGTGARSKADLTKAQRNNTNIKCKNCAYKSIGSNHKSWKGVGELSGCYWNRTVRNAKSRDLEFTITKEYAWNKFIEQDRRCAITNEILTVSSSYASEYSNQTASLDRIDNNKGYIEGNVWWIHKDINIMKCDHKMGTFVEWCGKVYLNNKEKIQKVETPSWPIYFLDIAKAVSVRSQDAQTQHGCVITDRNQHIIGTGYNSFPRQSLDNILPNLRPDKYAYMTHAERNCLSNLTISPWTIQEGAIAYLTGKPCLDCLQALWNTNITKVYSDKRSTSSYKPLEHEQDKFNFFIASHKIEYIEVDC